MVRSIRWNGRKPYGTGTPRQRHDHAGHPSSNTAIASFDRGAEPEAWHQSEDRREVAKARDGGRSQDGAEGSSLHRSQQCRGGKGCRFPKAHDQLRAHLADFIAVYIFARRLKTLSSLTPYEYVCKIWTSDPDRFIVDPIHQMPGLNT